MKFRKFAQRVLLKVSSWLEPPVWEGVYSRFSDVPSSGQGFEGPEWAAQSQAALEILRKDSKTYIPHAVPSEHLLLPFLLGLLARQKETVRVLDFGGGYGLFYQQVLHGVSDHARIDYHILETEGVCKRAAILWKDHAGIHFHDEWPRFPAPVDVLFFSSSLHYVNDYQTVLKKLCGNFQPRYILFVKFSAGEIPTYATAQKNLDRSTIPFWFFNVKEVVNLLRECGYRLAYKSSLEKPYPQRGFPQSHRMGKTSNLLFVQAD
jgi:putative methyltransferase (TIGR04325 family)